MKIGLDYGGVISFAPDGWCITVKNAIAKGHEVYIVSHVQPKHESQLQLRVDFAEQSGAINLTFFDFEWATERLKVGEKKAELCNRHGIEIFIDDDLFLCQKVGELCNRCASFYIPINLWQVGQRLIDGLGKDW